MARRHNSDSGCGCLLFGLAMFFVLPMASAVVGTTVAAPGVVAYLLVTEPATLGAHGAAELWWAFAAAAPPLLWLLCWAVVARRVQPSPLVHLRRAVVLLGLSTVAVVTALGSYPPLLHESKKESAALLTVWGAAAGIVLIGLIAIRFRDRRLPLRPRVYRLPTSRYVPPQPEPGEVWFAMVAFDRSEGEKDRPVLVLRSHEHDCEVLQITSQNKSHRSDHVLYRQPTGNPGEVYGWMELRVRRVPLYEFRRLTDDLLPRHIWTLANSRFGLWAA